MSWWSRLARWKRWLLGLVAACVLAPALIVIGWTLFAPIVGSPICSLVGCLGGGVEIVLVGRVLPERYSIEVDFPSGTRMLVCDLALDIQTTSPFDSGDHCTATGAFFGQLDLERSFRFHPPEELTVTLVIDSERITKVYRPDYHLVYPNGEHCDPMCYSATIEFDLSEVR